MPTARTVINDSGWKYPWTWFPNLLKMYLNPFVLFLSIVAIFIGIGISAAGGYMYNDMHMEFGVVIVIAGYMISMAALGAIWLHLVLFVWTNTV
ncbi:hypothetical protein KDA11_03970 [Candidatus Saccharibacteria bacterium]|nr:hypothetical protein [Candidatus Saccharibacteria bacterium]